MSVSKDFTIKNLPESQEIQESYDQRDYFNVVLKCRVFLESWLSEYIYALIFPDRHQATKENRRFINERFSEMYYHIQWLYDNGHISKAEFDNLKKIRAFSERVFRKNDVLAISTIKELDDFVRASIGYCQKFKVLTRRIIETAALKTPV